MHWSWSNAIIIYNSFCGRLELHMDEAYTYHQYINSDFTAESLGPLVSGSLCSTIQHLKNAIFQNFLKITFAAS